MMHWYLVQSKPHQENLADLNLQRLGVETLCPQLKQFKRIRWRKQEVTGPLFPGYLFAKFDVCKQYRTVYYASGVRKVVTFGDVAARVEEEIINSIYHRIQDGFVTLGPLSRSFTAGQLLQITEGPFVGLEGVFERELTGSQRIALLLNAVTYQARIIIDKNFVTAC